MPQIAAVEFLLAVSMSDLVSWHGDGDDEFVGNPDLLEALNVLGVTVDLREVYNSYFDQLPVGAGDVHVYSPSINSKNVFVLDLYRGRTDQLDLVTLGVRCEHECIPLVRGKLRAFFDGADSQVHYEEASCLAPLRKMIDSKTYPAVIEDGGCKYLQQVHYIYGQPSIPADA